MVSRARSLHVERSLRHKVLAAHRRELKIDASSQLDQPRIIFLPS